MRKTFSFGKCDEDWFINLPEWDGSPADLEMVAGAGVMLENLSNGRGYVALDLSDEPFEGAEDKLVLVHISVINGGGAYYLLDSNDMDVWLCDVVKFVFGEFPEEIHFKVAQEDAE